MKIRFAVLPILLFVVVFGTASANAQPAGRLEVGVQATTLRLSDFGQTNTGIGGRVSFDLSRWVALEAEGNFTPDDDIVNPSKSTFTHDVLDLRVAYHRRRADASFGTKFGHRMQKLGLFAKVRPGFVRNIDRGLECVGVDCDLVRMQFVRPEYRTEFALDLGGGVEFYPSRRTVARVELGDTMIRHRSNVPPCPLSACTSHNVGTRFGMGYRF